MQLVRANKYRLYPTAKQKALLHEMFGMYRFAFNNTLGKIQDSYFGTYEVKRGKNKGKIVSKIPSQSEIIGFSTKLKTEHKFMSKLPNDYIQASLSNLYLGVKGFYRGGGFPKFKSKHDHKQVINMKAGSRVKIVDNFIHLNRSAASVYSKNDHKIKFKKHKTNHEIGKITGFTIEKDNLGLYWISITFKIDVELHRKRTGKTVGLDLGIKELYTSSDNEVVHNHNLTKKYEKKLAKKQRRLSKKKPGSKNRLKARIKVVKIHRKISNTRKHVNHTETKKLINLYDFIGLESLDIKQMIENKQSKLSKSISNVAWSTFIQYLTYKADENQVQISKIDKWFPSSKACSNCGNVKKVLKLSERTYNCEVCGLEIDRDYNAALNILVQAKIVARKE